jgi:hypothetical protein
MSPHVQAVGFKSIDHIVLPPVYHQVLPRYVHTPNVSRLERRRMSDIVPSIGVRRRRPADALLPAIVLALDEEVRSGKAPIVEQVGYKDA